MKIFRNLFGIGLVVMFLSSCAAFQQKPKAAVMSYEMVGTILIEFQRQAKPLCDSGVISADDCINLKVHYNSARDLFIRAGNILAAGIDNPDNLSQFSSIMAELNIVVPQLIEVMSKYIPLKGVST